MDWWRGEPLDLRNWDSTGINRALLDTLVAPDGTQSAELLSENTAAGLHRLEKVIKGVATNKPYVFSVYAKAAGRSKLRLELLDTQGKKYGTATYDLQALKPLFNTGDVTHGGIEADRDGWLRCWAQTSFGGNVASATLALVNDNMEHDYAGDGKSGLALWGVQLSLDTSLLTRPATAIESKTNEYKKVSQYFSCYPKKSLIHAGTREFLYHAIRSMHPEWVLEIGSFCCGTSEVMARALWENKNGTLITLDPFGSERCPYIISQWPADLQKHVDFRAKNFMEVQPVLFSEGKRLDLALIDGNHDYEFALFDIMAAAAIMKPGGLLVIDNVEQEGPFWAGIDFLRMNADWTELGYAIEEFDSNNPFNMDRASLPDTSLLILKAPQQVVVAHQRSEIFGQNFIAHKVIQGIKVDLTQKTSGILHVHIIYRSWGGAADNIEENKTTDKFIITNDKLSFDCRFKEPLFSKMENAGEEIRSRSIEMALFWQGDDGGSLCLKEKPIYLL
jgi:predicted O-methyltransferase YrrM